MAIAQTLAYFDIFDYPLTATELYAYLWHHSAINQSAFLETLEKAKNSGIVEQKNGYYFLPGREDSISVRERAVRHVAHKLDRAKRAGKLIRYLPFLQAMFVCNTVAAGCSDETSDIDVLIVVKQGRIWLTRLFVTGLLGLFGLRRTKKKIVNQICLSFYLTDTNLNLQSIALKEADIYLCYWIRQLLPVYDPSNLYQKIQDANRWVNQWVAPNAPYQLIDRYRAPDTRLSSAVKNLFTAFWSGSYGDIIESQAKQIQQTHMKFHPPVPSENPRSVIMNDAMLKFHENDRREYFRDEWRKRISNF